MGEDMIHNIICLVIGYFCGCISSGYFVGKFHHIDIREHGSGNAGTTNVLRVLGKLPALITFVGDLAKAVMPILVIRIFLSPDNWYLLCLYMGLGVYLPLITTNCAVLGIALTNVQNSYNLIESVISGFGTAVGFTIAIIIMAGIRERNEYNDVPESFQGMPIVLLTAGLMSIAFFGFSGIL